MNKIDENNISSPSKVEISSENIFSNINQFRQVLSKIVPSESVVRYRLAAVVKANAYGHGVKEVVSLLEDKVDYFQVDDFLELKEIRQYTKKPVLVFGYVAQDELSNFVDYDAILGIYDLVSADILNNAAMKKNKKVKVHVKVDAFLGRQGILIDGAKDFFENLKSFNNLEVEAIYSHFSNIEDVDDLRHAKLQHETLLEVKEIAKQIGFSEIFHHISATSGILTDMNNNWGGAILRLGIGMYGLWPSENLKKRCDSVIDLRPIMRWVTEIAQVKKVPANFPIGYGCTFVTKKETTIAVIPQGYSDGYDRAFSNDSEVLIHGKRCPVLGRIAMNMFVVDATEVSNFNSNDKKISIGDEVVLLGRQGNEEITAEELAEGTINYEIVTRIWPKLPRVIIE